MVSWEYTCIPCERGHHNVCLGTPSKECNCARSDHGTLSKIPRKVRKPMPKHKKKKGKK